VKKQKKPLLSNKWILILKVASACVLLFISAFFFFQNLNIFWSDLRTANPPLFFIPVLFVICVILVCAYIIFLLFKVDDGKVYRADRFDIIYKIIYSFIVLLISVRSFFVEPYLEAPIVIVVISLIFGVANWMIPNLYYHDSEDF